MGAATCRTCRYGSRCLERSRMYPCRDYQERKEEDYEMLG